MDDTASRFPESALRIVLPRTEREYRTSSTRGRSRARIGTSGAGAEPGCRTRQRLVDEVVLEFEAGFDRVLLVVPEARWFYGDRLMSTSTVVLVHGGGGTPETWDPVIVELRARGVAARAADLPTARRTDATLADDAAHVRELASGDESTILCGHSWGGTVITEAGSGIGGLVHLVYLAAFMPDRGETTAQWGGKRMMEPPVPVDFRDDGTMQAATWIVDESDQRYDAAALERIAARPPPRPFVVSAAVTPLRGAAWHGVPSTYVVTLRDSFLHPDTQREMATRASRVVEMDCDHDITAVFPDEIAELLASLATS